MSHKKQGKYQKNKKIAHNESTNLVIISQRWNLHLLTYNVLSFRECRSFIAQSFVLCMTCTSAGCFYAHRMLEFTDNTHILRPPLYFLNLSLPRCSKLHKHTLQHQRPLRFLLHNFPRFQLKIDKKCWFYILSVRPYHIVFRCICLYREESSSQTDTYLIMSNFIFGKNARMEFKIASSEGYASWKKRCQIGYLRFSPVGRCTNSCWSCTI